MQYLVQKTKETQCPRPDFVPPLFPLLAGAHHTQAAGDTLDMQRKFGTLLAVDVRRFVECRDDIQSPGPQVADYLGVSAQQVASHGQRRTQEILLFEHQAVEQAVLDRRPDSTSVFCRTGIEGDSVGRAEAQEKLTLPDPTTLTDAEKKARFAFLKTLAGQYDSRGDILLENTSPYKYFSEWYIHGYEGHPGWNQYTPWCGCFLSWAADQQKASINGDPPSFADVDEGMEKFKDSRMWRERGDTNNKPIPGDYVFFDWDGRNDPDGGKDPDHVGAVLCVEGNFLYTIEGNSGGRVAVNRYPLSDSRIVGYGVLNWKTE